MVCHSGKEHEMIRCRTLRSAAVMTLVVVVHPLVAVAEINPPPVRVEADGVSPIENGQVTQAKERAIHDALRRAVESGAGVGVISESSSRGGQLISDHISAQAEGLVEHYEMLSESKRDGAYHVRIMAMVSKAKVINDLADLLVLDQQMDMPVIMVLLRDAEGNYDDAQRSGRTILEKKFTERRFRLIDESISRKLQEDRGQLARLDDNDFATRLANEHAADLVVVCTLNTEDRGSRSGFAESQAILRLKTINPTTGQIFVGDESELTGSGDTYSEASRAAARRVASESSTYAINQLVLWWVRQTGSGSGGEYIIELQNPGTARTGLAFTKAIRKVQGVRQVKRESSTNKLLRLRVLFEGGAGELLMEGIFDQTATDPKFESLDLPLQRGNQLVFSLGGSSGASDAATPRAEPPFLGVIPFKNTTAYAALDSTADACWRRAESVCVSSKRFRVIDRSHLDVVLQEADFRDAGMLEGADAMRLGKLLPAQVLMMGQISGQKQTLRVHARIVRTDTGEVLHSIESEIHYEDRDRLPDALAASLETAIDHRKVRDYLSDLGIALP